MTPGFDASFMIRTLTLLSASLLGIRIFNHGFVSKEAAFAILVHTVCFTL